MTNRALDHARVLILGFALLASSNGRVRADPQTGSSWITQAARTQLLERLRTALPRGWTVTPSENSSVPDTWRSVDTRSLAVDGANGDQTFRIWFVPRDWIGIRQPDPRRVRGYFYWEGVLVDETYTAITPDGPFVPYDALERVPVYAALHAMGMHQPSLINSGWREGMARYGPRLSDVDDETQRLVRSFCETRACADEAAYSLIILGVPAKTLTLDCAEHAVSSAQAACLDVLAYWNLPESLPILRAAVANPSAPASVRRSGAFSLGRLADMSAGPALRQALQATPAGDRNTATAIARTLGRIRDQAAGSSILARLENERERWAQLVYITALADMRYTPAVAAIERLCETTTVSADWIAEKRRADQDFRAELQWLRLVGPWGPPFQGLRLRILPPADPVGAGRIRVASLIENTGDVDLDSLRSETGIWMIDGKDHANLDVAVRDGFTTLSVNGVDVRSVDLVKAAELQTPGTHSVQYRLRGAISNQLTIRVQ